MHACGPTCIPGIYIPYVSKFESILYGGILLLWLVYAIYSYLRFVTHPAPTTRLLCGV